MKITVLLKEHWRGLFISLAIGLIAIMIKRVLKSPVLDPLLIALTIGITIRSIVRFDDNDVSALKVIPSLFIPPGVIFYGAANLNFNELARVDTKIILLLFIVLILYMILTLLSSALFGLREKTGYLIAAGSAICGASAIAITSDAIDAEPDDVSLSLIPVYISGLIGLFIILPALSSYFKIPEMMYGIFSGVVLQFTGFVKAAVSNLSGDIKSAALSIKAVRYIGLLFVIPLVASFIKGRFYIPWYLWGFLLAGLLFSFMPAAKPYGQSAKAILTVLWSIAMGSIGLNADPKSFITIRGLKAFGASFISFLITIGVFLIGMKFI